ncbi:MAG: restriction endonuclease subunit S [Planctomycetota bacterium]
MKAIESLRFSSGDVDIRAKQKVISLLNEQKQVIIHRAVTRGLAPDVPLKPSGIHWLGDIPKHWELAPLKSLCFVQSGVTLGKYYAGQSLVEYPYLRVANVQAGHLNLEVMKSLWLPADEANRYLLRVGDVLMTEGGDPDKLGRGCVWEGQVTPCLHQNHIFAVRPDAKKLIPKYLSALLSSDYAKNYFLLTAKQTTNLASTNRGTIGKFHIPLPNLEEQNSILFDIEKSTSPIDQTISQTQRQITLLQEFRIRLIADVVTGKLDVREAARRIPDETEAADSQVEKVKLSSGYDDLDSSGLTEWEESDEIDSDLLGYKTGANQ